MNEERVSADARVKVESAKNRSVPKLVLVFSTDNYFGTEGVNDNIIKYKASTVGLFSNHQQCSFFC